MILSYLTEQLTEGRFDFTKPESHTYNGIQQIGVGMVNGVAVSRDTSTISFSTEGMDYVLRLLTTIKYEPVLTDTGEIQYDVQNDFIVPYFVDENGEKTELTNEVMSSDIGKEVAAALKEEPALVSINREFDVAGSEEKFATTGAGKPIPKINMTYFLLKKVFLDGFSKIHLPVLHQQIFKSTYSKFVQNLTYELESITLIAKPDYEGDERRANIYRRWWKTMGSQVGAISNIDEEPTEDGISFEVSFNNTPL